MAKTNKNNGLPQSLQTALIEIYHAGGGKMRRPEESTVNYLYNHGFLKSHNNLCWAWATYTLSPTGVNKASEICGY